MLQKDLSKSSLSKDSAITQDSLQIDKSTAESDWLRWSLNQQRFENPSQSSKNVSVARKPSLGSKSDTKSVKSYKSGKSSKQQNTGKDSKNHGQGCRGTKATWQFQPSYFLEYWLEGSKGRSTYWNDSYRYSNGYSNFSNIKARREYDDPRFIWTLQDSLDLRLENMESFENHKK